jgi:hypothetical protein
MHAEHIEVSLCTQPDPTYFCQPWPHVWPKSVEFRGVYKLTSICPRAFVGTNITYIGHAVEQLVVALCYKTEGRRFDSP